MCVFSVVISVDFPCRIIIWFTVLACTIEWQEEVRLKAILNDRGLPYKECARFTDLRVAAGFSGGPRQIWSCLAWRDEVTVE